MYLNKRNMYNVSLSTKLSVFCYIKGWINSAQRTQRISWTYNVSLFVKSDWMSHQSMQSSQRTTLNMQAVSLYTKCLQKVYLKNFVWDFNWECILTNLIIKWPTIHLGNFIPNLNRFGGWPSHYIRGSQTDIQLIKQFTHLVQIKFVLIKMFIFF